MRNRCFLRKNSVRLLILLSLTCAAISPAAVNVIDQDALKGYLENGSPHDFILIDVRSAEEASAGGIGSSQCKPYNLAWQEQFVKEFERIPKDRTIIVYCRSGARAARAAATLDSIGFTNVYNAGGILTWTGPTVPFSEFKPASLLPEPSMKAKADQKTSR
jgi:rhodanese-related sulfurtransferase